MSVEKKVLEAVTDYDLLAGGESVLVALSGGPDSVALLRILHGLRKKYQLTLYAVYINHNIRKRAAREEERFCRKLCDKFKTELFIVFEDIPALAKSTRKSVEQAARDFRYQTFASLCDKHRLDRVAVGHHFDDRVETVLFRIIRGTGKTGLQGIPPRRGRIIRPLYNLDKQEILSYLKRKRLSYCVDQSNTGIDYDRNYIRNRLLPDIRENLNPAVDRAIFNLSEIAVEEEAFLDDYINRKAKGLISSTVGGKIELDLEKYNRYDKWFRRRLLRHCLAGLSPSEQMPDKIVVDRLDDLCRKGEKGLSMPGGIQAVIAGNRAVIYRRAPVSYGVAAAPGKVCRLKTLRLDFRMSVHGRETIRLNRDKQSRTVQLDFDKVVPPFEVRNVRSGDRFKPLGLIGTKSVGDYFTDRKVHSVYRDEIPVVCDSKGILWLVGYEISDRAKIDSSTRKVLKIGFSRRKKTRVEAVRVASRPKDDRETDR
jgi:tRNA(Ile)-lysidine synthase